MSSRFLSLAAALLVLALAGCVPEHERGDRPHATAASIARRAYYQDRRFDNDIYYHASLEPNYIWGEYDGPYHYGYGGRLPEYGWGDRYSQDRPGTLYRAPYAGGASTARSRARAGTTRVI